ncbi:glycoside hydrolase family 5 protein [Niastella caeni]|nr:cellulase family glycosylhydrolase [Niastella caeni]
MKLYVLLSTLIVIASCQKSNDPPPVNDKPQRLTIEGKNIKTPDGNVIELRGVNWGWWETAQPQDATEAVAMGARVVRMPFRWYFGGDGSNIRQTDAPGHIKPEGLQLLDQYINWCTEQKIWVLLFAGSDQGAGDSTENYWTNASLKKEFIETWEFLVQRYKNKPYIAAYELLSEPHPKKPVTNQQVVSFYEDVISAIRKHDTLTPLMIGPNDHYDINLLEESITTKDKKIIYTFNYYLPTDYIKPDKREQAGLPIVSYPGSYNDFNGNAVNLNKDYLTQILQPAVQFRNKYNVPVFVNQMGARSRCPNNVSYLTDVCDIFYQYQIPFTYWTYRTNSDQSEYGIYWFNKTTNQYVFKPEPAAVLSAAFKRK